MYKYILLLLLSLNLYSTPTQLSLELIKKHEGLRLVAYKDSKGMSIGYGTNLSYITKKEAEYLLRSRLYMIDLELTRSYEWYTKLPYIPKSIVIDMVYNLGLTRFSKFLKLHRHLEANNWVKSALEMKDSVWYRQVGLRGKYLYKMMVNYN
jgi:lysozyme